MVPGKWCERNPGKSEYELEAKGDVGNVFVSLITKKNPISVRYMWKKSHKKNTHRKERRQLVQRAPKGSDLEIDTTT